MNLKKLETWVRKMLYQVGDSGKCTRIVNRHVKQNNQYGHQIADFPISREERVTDDKIAELLTEMDTASRDDAEGIGGLQKYVALAWFEKKDEPVARLPFRQEGQSLDLGGGNERDGESLDSEPGNQQGLLTQLMRHNEAMMRIMLLSQQTSTNGLIRHNARQSEMIETLVEEKFASLTVIEQMYTQRHEREQEAKQLESKERRTSELMDKALMFAPIVLNRLAGKKLVPEKITSEMALVGSLMESLTPEQLEMFQEKLRPEQQAVLFELMQAARGAFDAKKKEAAKQGS